MGTESPHGLDVRLGDLLGLIVGMAHLIARERSFSADLTGTCHGNYLLNLKIIA
jgi:hypothetical protein